MEDSTLLPIFEASKILKDLLRENDLTLVDRKNIIPVSITPYYLSKKHYEDLCKKTELVMEALEVILGQYLVNQEIQDYFPEVDHLKHLIFMDGKHTKAKRFNHFSRIDCILRDDGEIGILELNPFFGLGLLTTPRIKQLYESLPPHEGVPSNQIKMIDQPFEDMSYFFNHLTKVFQEYRNTNQSPCIAFISHSWLYQMATDKDQFLELAKKNVVDGIGGTYDQLEYNGEYLSMKGKKIDIVWHLDLICTDQTSGKVKHFITENSKGIQNLINAYNDTNVLFVNGFLPQFVAESKKMLALMKDPKFSYLFTKDQLQAIEDIIPPTYILNSKDLRFTQLYKSILENKDKYVIKSTVDCVGRNVFIGKSIDQKEWEKIVQKAVDGPFAIQQFIQSKQSLVHNPRSEKTSSMATTLAIFLVGGKGSGMYIRSSDTLINNLNFEGEYSKGGGVLQVCYVVDD